MGQRSDDARDRKAINQSTIEQGTLGQWRSKARKTIHESTLCFAATTNRSCSFHARLHACSPGPLFHAIFFFHSHCFSTPRLYLEPVLASVIHRLNSNPSRSSRLRHARPRAWSGSLGILAFLSDSPWASERLSRGGEALGNFADADTKRRRELIDARE